MVADVAYLQQNQQQIEALEPLLAAQRAAYRANPMPSAEQRRAWLKALRELILGEKQALIEAVSRDFRNRAAEETLQVRALEPALEVPLYAVSRKGDSLTPIQKKFLEQVRKLSRPFMTV